MENSSEKFTSEEPPADLPVQTENIAYAADEMIACAGCARRNPPNRLKCLYCGAELVFTAEQTGSIKPVLRKMETWEKGFNVIFLPAGTNAIGESAIRDVARMTRLDAETVRGLFAANRPLPVARAGSEKEAEIVRDRLAETGIETRIVSDATLAPEIMPRRLRGLQFSSDKVLVNTFNTDEILEIAGAELILIVTGSIFEKRVEATEKRVRKGDGNTLLSATETATDEKVIDIYARGDAFGFRVEQKGFDFSCLGADKSLVAADNIARLAERLRAFAPEAKLIEDYPRMRSLLGAVWEISERKDSKGLVRERFGKFNLGNVTVMSNAEQFTKYSRMLKYVYEEKV